MKCRRKRQKIEEGEWSEWSSREEMEKKIQAWKLEIRREGERERVQGQGEKWKIK